jgi:hypothetical protein
MPRLVAQEAAQADPQESSGGSAPKVGRAVRFAVTPALQDLRTVRFGAPASQLQAAGRTAAGLAREIPRFDLSKGAPRAAADNGADAALQASASSSASASSRAAAPAVSAPMPPPILTFDGLSNEDNFTVYGGRVIPADPNGDVGPNHYVQTVNLLVEVFDKGGVSLTGPFPMSLLFGSLGPLSACAALDDGDPIVVYDPLADRWLISQFALPLFPTAPYFQCIAISRTADPTGAYYAYEFEMPNAKLNDYPKFGVWPDAYYMTDNQFLFDQAAGGFSFAGGGAFAFDRERMLMGDPTATFVYFDLEAVDPTIGGMLPSDLDGLTPPPPGRRNTFAYFVATEYGDAVDGLRLFDFKVDFTRPERSRFTERRESPLPVAAFNPLDTPGRGDIEQPNPLTPPLASCTPVPTCFFLDSIQDRVLYRLQYRNFGSHESLVVNHTVNVGTGTTTNTHQSGVRYYELRRDWNRYVVHEQASFAPDGDNRWMGSAAMDHRGNLAVGYSVSSRTTFPSIRYAGRLASDPPGGLFQSERTLFAGADSQRSNSGRWGDYSSLSVDPVDDCTFWYTNEYYEARGPSRPATSTAHWLTRIGSFKFNECRPRRQGSLTVHVTACRGDAAVPNASVEIDDTLYGVTDAEGTFSTRLPPGRYEVEVSSSAGSDEDEVTIRNGRSQEIDLCVRNRRGGG